MAIIQIFWGSVKTSGMSFTLSPKLMLQQTGCIIADGASSRYWQVNGAAGYMACYYSCQYIVDGIDWLDK